MGLTNNTSVMWLGESFTMFHAEGKGNNTRVNIKEYNYTELS